MFKVYENISEFFALIESSTIQPIGYQSKSWLNYLVNCFNCDIRVAVILENGQVKSCLPFSISRFGRNLVSLPYSHAVSIFGEKKSDKELLIDCLMKYASDRKSALCIKAYPCQIGNALVKIDSGMVWSKMELFNDIKLQMKGYSSTCIRNYKLFKKKGAVIQLLGNEDEKVMFQELMVQTRRRQGVPCYPFDFLKHLTSLFGEEDVKVLLAKAPDGQVIAGMVLYHYSDTTLYLYGASSTRNEYLAFKPNNGLMHAAIQIAIERGSSIFDFGVSHHSNEGLIRFKDSFGAKTKPMLYVSNAYYSGGRARDGYIFKLVSLGISKLPMWVYKKLSKMAIYLMS